MKLFLALAAPLLACAVVSGSPAGLPPPENNVPGQPGFRRLPNSALWDMLLAEFGFEQMRQSIRDDLQSRLGRVLNLDEYKTAFVELERCIDRLRTERGIIFTSTNPFFEYLNMRIDDPPYGSEAEALAMDDLLVQCTDFVVAAVGSGQLSLAHGWREGSDPTAAAAQNRDADSGISAGNPAETDRPLRADQDDNTNNNNNNAFSMIRLPIGRVGGRERPSARGARVMLASKVDRGRSLLAAGRAYVGAQMRAGKLFLGGGGMRSSNGGGRTLFRTTRRDAVPRSFAPRRFG